MTLTKTEQENVDLAQKGLKMFKRATKNLQNENTKAGRAEAANDIYGLHCEAGVLHAKATTVLMKYHKEDGEVVVLGGGAGRD
jgi:hypothetical protein